MREFVVRYVNGPLQGQGSIAVPDDAGHEPPMVQRIPLPQQEQGMRKTLTETWGAPNHAIYERSVYNDGSGEWEYSLVRVE